MASVTYTVKRIGSGLTADPPPGGPPITLASHVPYWYLAGGVVFSPAQEPWTRDIVGFERDSTVSENVQVQITAGNFITPQLYCIVPYPVAGGNLQQVDLTAADAGAAPNSPILISFQAGAAGGPPPNQFPLVVKAFTVRMNGTAVEIRPKSFSSSIEPLPLPISFQSRDAVILEREDLARQRQLVVQNSVVGVPPLVFGIADPVSKDAQRRLMTLNPLAAPSGANIVLTFADQGAGGDPPGGPPP